MRCECGYLERLDEDGDVILLSQEEYRLHMKHCAHQMLARSFDEPDVVLSDAFKRYSEACDEAAGLAV